MTAEKSGVGLGISDRLWYFGTETKIPDGTVVFASKHIAHNGFISFRYLGWPGN